MPTSHIHIINIFNIFKYILKEIGNVFQGKITLWQHEWMCFKGRWGKDVEISRLLSQLMKLDRQSVHFLHFLCE